MYVNGSGNLKEAIRNNIAVRLTLGTSQACALIIVNWCMIY